MLPTVVPGKSAKSELMRRIEATDESERMPPEGDRLSAAEIQTIREWIDNIPDNPYTSRKDQNPNETHTKAALDTVINMLEEDAIVWIMTDNIIDLEYCALAAWLHSSARHGVDSLGLQC